MQSNHPWQRKEVIGDATLYLGDCLEIMPMLAKVDAVVTDPPYNVGKDYGAHNDSMPEEEYQDWMRRIINIARARADNQFWVAPRYKLDFFLPLFPGCHLIVITRGAAGPFRQGWSDQFETAISVGKPSIVIPDLWTNIRLKGEGYFFREETYGNPGYTPYLIMARAVELFGGNCVCDPFMGTGTAGVACVKSGRCFVGIEIGEPDFDIACKRIDQAERQGQFFEPKPPKAEQLAL